MRTLRGVVLIWALGLTPPPCRGGWLRCPQIQPGRHTFLYSEYVKKSLMFRMRWSRFSASGSESRSARWKRSIYQWRAYWYICARPWRLEAVWHELRCMEASLAHRRPGVCMQKIVVRGEPEWRSGSRFLMAAVDCGTRPKPGRVHVRQLRDAEEKLRAAVRHRDELRPGLVANLLRALDLRLKRSSGGVTLAGVSISPPSLVHKKVLWQRNQAGEKIVCLACLTTLSNTQQSKKFLDVVQE